MKSFLSNHLHTPNFNKQKKSDGDLHSDHHNDHYYPPDSGASPKEVPKASDFKFFPDSDSASLSHPPSHRSDRKSEHKSESDNVYPGCTGPRRPSIIPGAPAEQSEPTRAPLRLYEDEIRETPGSIQSYGALIGLKYNERGRLEVHIASDNASKVLGYLPQQLFALESFLDIVNSDHHDEFVARIGYALSHPEDLDEETQLDVLQLSLSFKSEPEIPLWCAIHLTPHPNRMIICEFEEFTNTAYLRDIGAARIVPVFCTPDLMDHSWSPDEITKSTTSASKPFQVLQIIRKRAQKDFTSLDILNLLTQAEKQLSACSSIQQLLDTTVGMISELTGFHRVMISRFDEKMNGYIDAELLNPQASTDIFRGLQFPAVDIPEESHKLYKLNHLSMLHDRDAPTARLVCRLESVEDLLDRPLDMSHSYLRAIASGRLRNLKYLGVKSALTISIVTDGKLWGLISCQGYGDNGVRVSLAIRELCRLIGNHAAFSIQRIHSEDRLRERKIPLANPLDPGANHNSPTEMLDALDADVAVFSVKDKQRAIGKLECYREAAAVILHLREMNLSSIQSSNSIRKDFPLLGPGVHDGPCHIAGFLYIPLTGGDRGDFLIFFRKPHIREMRWIGNPEKREAPPSQKGLKICVEEIQDTSKEWTRDQLDIAAVLKMMYRKSMELWPQKGIGSHRLAAIRKEIEKFRPTIGSIMNSLEEALGNCSDDRLREILMKTNISAGSMIHTANNLTKLTEKEKSTSPLDGIFDPNIAAANVLQDLQMDAIAKKNILKIAIHAHTLPALVKGDVERFKQVLVYFTENAFQFSTDAKVEIGTSEEGSFSITLRVEDSGPLRTEEQLDRIRHEIEVAQSDRRQSVVSNSSIEGAGIELSDVAKFIKEIQGQIHVSNGRKKGTIFTLILPFDAPPMERGATRRPSRQKLLARSLKVPGQSSINTSSITNLNMAGKDSEPMSPKSPVGGPKTLPPSTPPPPTPVSAARGKLRVLIAEANPATLKMLSEKLTGWGHYVEEVCDGQECHTAYMGDPSKFDLILMDLEMPLLDGTSATRMIRFSEKELKYKVKFRNAVTPQTPRIPIIAISSFLNEENRYDYIQSGFDGWIPKPIALTRLNTIIQGAKSVGSRKNLLYNPGGWMEGGWFTL